MIDININRAGYNDSKLVLEDFKLHIKKGEIVTVMGASGGGKSTLLKIIAGLSVKEQGTGLWYEGSISLGSSERIGFIPQNKCLLPWKTIYDNIILLIQSERKKIDSDKAKRLMKRLGLAGLEKEYPNRVSGGQYQRAMLGRTFFYEPDILLMDEPFTALDSETKKEIVGLFLELQKENQIPCVFVTHDLSEAEALRGNGEVESRCVFLRKE